MQKNLSHIQKKILRVISESLLFKNLENEFKKELISQFDTVSLDKGDILDFNDSLKWVYISISGRIKASRINPEKGKEYILYLYAPGDIFNIISIIDDKVPHALFECVDDVTLLRIEMEVFKSWIENNPVFNKNFLLYVVEKLKYTQDSASDLALHETHTRLSKLILKNIDEENPEDDNKYSVKFINDLSNEVIANMIGSVRNVVNRNIQKLKSDDILEVPSRKEKKVINLEGLEKSSKSSL